MAYGHTLYKVYKGFLVIGIVLFTFVEVYRSTNLNDVKNGALLHEDEMILLHMKEANSIEKEVANINDLTNFARTFMQLLPLSVYIWPLNEFGINNAENIHVQQNGVDESPYLRMISDPHNFDPNVVWVGDTGDTKIGWGRFCSEFHKRIVEAKQKRANLDLPLSWPIFIIDFTDGQTHQRCKEIETEVGKDFIKYTKRSIVQGRGWEFNDNKTKVGFNFGHRAEQTENGIHYQHTPLNIRTDTIDTLNDVLKTEYNGTRLNDAIEKLPREIDVAHFWPVDGTTNVGSIHSELRTQVSRIIQDMGENNETAERDLNVFVGLAGSAVRKGRRGVKTIYVRRMLESKIVVVTQRDRWEDHYRLFEALTSGAMVMTDRMLSLPAGLQNGTSIIEFTSGETLRSLIRYFVEHDDERLAIAARGREVSMAQHRTWHRIEEVIFGRILSSCNNTARRPDSPCPYIIHANEAR